jgi:CRP-like cAMP-binding protein
MIDQAGAPPMTEAQRLVLLSETYLFNVLPFEQQSALASTAALRHICANDLIMRQGEVADAVLVVVSGRGEESVWEGGRSIPVALVARGEVIGEEALRRDDRSYGSTVRALEPMAVLAIPLETVLPEAGSAELGAALARDAETVDRVTFVKRATPFAALSPAAARQLAANLSSRRIEPGEYLVCEGELGDACYLVRKGRFAVEAGAGQALPLAAKPIAVLERGELVGEVSLLACEPHRASVVALEPGEVLVLRRSDLMKALAASRELAGTLTMRARLRVRPDRIGGIERHVLTRADGETITILKDPVRGAYFRLSELGAFVWDQLDGTRTIRSLVIEQMAQAHRFAPAAIAEIVAGLMVAGFVRTRTDMTSLGLALPAAAGRPLQGLRRLLVRTIAERDPVRADRVAGHLYRWLAPLTGRSALLYLAGTCLAGIALIGAGVIEAWDSGGRVPSWALAAIFFVLSLLCHEIGHALAMKALGRTVNGYGIGWYWLVPFAYVDTTDAWLAPPLARAGIALAGPFANLVLASLAAIIATSFGGGFFRDSAWLLAAVNILLCLAALSPAGDNDGAQALEQWLGSQSRTGAAPFRFILSNLAGLMAGRPISSATAGGAFAFVLHTALVAGTGFVAYHLIFESEVAGIVGERPAEAVGVVLAGLAASVIAAGSTVASSRGRPT